MSQPKTSIAITMSWHTLSSLLNLLPLRCKKVESTWADHFRHPSRGSLTKLVLSVTVLPLHIRMDSSILCLRGIGLCLIVVSSIYVL